MTAREKLEQMIGDLCQKYEPGKESKMLDLLQETCEEERMTGVLNERDTQTVSGYYE